MSASRSLRLCLLSIVLTSVAPFATIDAAAPANTALSMMKAPRQLIIDEFPQISAPQLHEAFVKIRDSHIIPAADPRAPKRRIAWLYPDEGCQLRAEISSTYLEKLNYPSPVKIHVLRGRKELSFKTKLSLTGKVNWPYHVAIVYRVENSVYVLDPATNRNGPTPMSEWFRLIGDPRDFKVAICDSHSDILESRQCVGEKPWAHDAIQEHRDSLLEKEQKRLEDLRLDIRSLLGI